MTTTKTTQAKPQPRPATRDHLTSLKKPVQKKVQILLDTDLVDVYEKAQERLGEATAETREARIAELETARNAIAESTVEMTFKSLGRKKYEALVADHPPTKEQNERSLKEVESEASYNIETFPPALIQASCVSPELTMDDVQAIYDEWNTAEIMELFFAALEVNTARRTVDLGNAFGLTPS